MMDWNRFLDVKSFEMQIGPVQGSNNSNSRVKVRVQLNMNGIVTVESATVSNISIRFPTI